MTYFFNACCTINLVVSWIVGLSVTFPNIFRNEQKSIFHAGFIWLRRMKHWNSKNKQTKTNQKGIISTSRFRNYEYVQKISCSFKRSPLLYIFLCTHHLSAKECFDLDRKKLLIGLSLVIVKYLRSNFRASRMHKRLLLV